MKGPGRFEWKILATVLLVALMAVGTASYGLQFILGRLGALSIEHHRRIGGASRQADKVFRDYFAERKEEFRIRRDQIAASPPRHLAELAGVEGLLQARLLDQGKVVDEWSAPIDAQKRSAPAPPGPPAVLPSGRILELTFGIPREMYDSFFQLRQAMDDEHEEDRAYNAVVPSYLKQFTVLMVSVLLMAPVVGLVLARRVTRRVRRLHEAAQRVGAGDLTVRVAPTGRDEIDELARAFDRMVSELADARSRLEYLQKVSAWQEVARRLAHEIKNPLTPIQLAVQELGSKYRGDDPAYQSLLETAQEILHEEITSLRRLVDDFSAFAKLPRVEPAPVDLAALVAEAVRLQPEWHPSVQVERAAAPVPALCDKTLFRRVIANLVENALQAAKGAGKTPEVRLSVASRPAVRRAAVIVDDNGPGVAAAERQRIFDPYVTHKEGGTGLGLAIVRKIVIDHGGDVIAQDAPPPLGGARFVVEIPSG